MLASYIILISIVCIGMLIYRILESRHREFTWYGKLLFSTELAGYLFVICFMVKVFFFW